MSGEFAGILNESFAKHLRPAQASKGADYLLSPARLAEADDVEPCAARLATAEIFPPSAGRGVGRYSPVSLTAPLASKLGSRLVRADMAKRHAARTSVLRVLALGYGGVLNVEASAIERGELVSLQGIEPEAIWDRWVVTLNGPPIVKVLDRGFVDTLHRIGHGMLLEDLRAAGLAPRLGAGRLRYIAWWYVEAGMSLRALQTDLFGELGGAEADLLAATVNLWPFDSLRTSLPDR